MKKSLITGFIIVIGGLLLSVTNISAGYQAEININVSQDFGPVKLRTGFVHGITYDPTKDYTKTINLISALKPQSWRLSNYSNKVYEFVVKKANFPLNQGTKIIFAVQDAFNIKYGMPPIKLDSNCPAASTICFQTFDKLKKTWEAFLNEFMQTMAVEKPTIDVYDIFAEPDWTWEGLSWSQRMELFKIAHNVIRQYRPDAKISAPSTSFYNKEMLETFLDFVVANNLRLDALSWHEFDDLLNPEIVPVHAAQMRSAFAARPKLCNPNCPEIHINEYLGIHHHLIPGWNVGWLYYLEKAGVHQSSRSCWDVTNKSFPRKTWSTCWAGFDGMLMEDNITPQHIYWVYKAYADGYANGMGKRLVANSTARRIVALASKDDAGQIQILTGRYDGDSGPVALNITGYPYNRLSSVRYVGVKIQKIPTNAGAPGPLASPEPLLIQYLRVDKDSFSIPIADFRHGEAYIVTVKSLFP